MIKTIWSKLTGGRLVWLRDLDGTITLSIARIDPFGDLRAERRWPFQIHSVVLLDGGKVEGSYVKAWIYANASKSNKQ